MPTLAGAFRTGILAAAVLSLFLAAAGAAEPAAVQVDDGGVTLRSADGDHQVRLRGFVQIDSRWFPGDDAEAAAGGFLLRRVRPVVEAVVARDWDARAMANVGSDGTILVDGWVGWNAWRGLRVRIGQFKPPVGLERLQSTSALALNERAFPTEFIPNRDVGLLLHGTVIGGRLDYAAAVLNGGVDGANVTPNPDDAMDVAGRLFLRPFQERSGHPLAGLAVGIGGSTGQESGTPAAPQLGAYRTPGQQRFFRYRVGVTPDAENTVVADGSRVRVAPQLQYQSGPVTFAGEFTTSESEVRLGEATAHLRHMAWQATATVVLTGEEASFGGVRPRRPFDPKHGQWGALELAGRWQELDVDDAAFPLFANPAAAARRAAGWSLGVNWTMTANLRASTQVARTRFDGGAADGDRAAETAVMTRMQLNY
jgi:phosphate-selective porin OprO/OprP